jgi:1-acyl-sn-glycerol-3-phosphate acyltransferase
MWAKSLAGALRMSVRQIGVGHIDPAEQYLVMPLHESFVDVPTLLHLPLDLRFTVRDELFDLPHIGRYLTATKQIAVAEAPSIGDLRLLYSGIAEAIAQGDSVVVFPQGSILGIEVAFLPGVVRLSQRFGLPVLPIAISGTHCVWEYPYAQTVRFDRTVALQVLAPISCADVSDESIRTAERAMKQIAMEHTEAPTRRFRPERDGWWDDYRYNIDEDFPELALRVQEHRDAIGEGSATT